MEKCANHNLHLALVGVAVASNARFDFARRIASDFNIVLLGREQNHAANLSEAQRGSHIQSRKYGFHGQSLGLELSKKFAEQGVDVAEYGVG